MNEQLLNGFNNGRDASDGVGGQSPLNVQYVDKSKTFETRHTEIKKEMLNILDAVAVLEEQYNTLQQELYSVEQEYMKNLQNLVK